MLKEWVVIHKIKALYDDGQGSSIREIARTLNISRNTVRKYLKLDEALIGAKQSDRARHKALDDHREYIVHLLKTFPRPSAVKVKRKLEEKVGSLELSSRSLRRYISTLREEVTEAQRRYYEPVLNHIPGVQCQVDPGELRDVLIDGLPTTVYFVVFVLSFSRLMHVGVSRRPINTETFMQLHDAAFRAFGGCPEECVYDQTRLVVIDEQYRELELNQRFAQYATAAGFRIRACEGYDPESKGKVEAGVKYVKQDALYGDTFADWSAMEQHLAQWLEQVANVRTHGATGEQPQVRYDQQEREKMRAYLSPSCLTPAGIPGEPRKVDKTGLISFKSNKYSVPMAWQSSRVNVLTTPDGQLEIYERQEGTVIACHPLSQGKGEVIKNKDHYRDKTKQIADLEEEITASLGSDLGPRLCHQLKKADPCYYKDKLRGVQRHLTRLASTEFTLSLI
jgi:transposase